MNKVCFTPYVHFTITFIDTHRWYSVFIILYSPSLVFVLLGIYCFSLKFRICTMLSMKFSLTRDHRPGMRHDRQTWGMLFQFPDLP